MEQQSDNNLDENNNLTQVISISKPYVHSANQAMSFKNDASINPELLNKESDNSLAQIQLSMQPKSLVANSNNNFIDLNQPKNSAPLITNKNIIQNADKTVNAKNKKSNHINLRPQPKTFYGTFFFSPNFATIKFQHINKPGYS